MKRITAKLLVSVTAFVIGTGIYLAWQTSCPATSPSSHSLSVEQDDHSPPSPQTDVDSGPCDRLGDAKHFGLNGKAKGIIFGGVLDGKACKSAPVYPQNAIDSKVTGTVTVQIVFDENGRVKSARALSGPRMLRPAAVDAAYLARFHPWALSGESVKVRGTLKYDFRLPGSPV